MKSDDLKIQLTNTLTGKKEFFEPIKPGKVKLYVCGITPYDEPHLGHGRCYVVFDVLKRALQKQFGEKNITHVQNFTDVDDKIIERARVKGADPATFANQFIDSFNHWMIELNVLPADKYPRVTDHMDEIVKLIQQLIDKGLGYVVNGDVYYAVKKFPDYGEISHRKLEDLSAGARVEIDERKSDPMDFALWKSAKPGEPSWPSPWGPGRPGWHIECSAMSMKYLGEEFDIHGGGLDLVFPHHENENAQSRGATGRKKFAHTWVHNGFVTINKEKMSKSLGNFFTLKEILSVYDPMTTRYFLLSQHYRSPLNFSDQELKAAQNVWLKRICEAYRRSADFSETCEHIVGGESSVQEAENLYRQFVEEISNDLNTAGALGYLNQLCSLIFVSEQMTGAALGLKAWKRLHDIFHSMLDMLGLIVPAVEKAEKKALQLLEDRETAREKKDWAEADRIRGELKSIGYAIEDTPAGPRVKKI